jgi:hypothetical protein
MIERNQRFLRLLPPSCPILWPKTDQSCPRHI